MQVQEQPSVEKPSLYDRLGGVYNIATGDWFSVTEFIDVVRQRYPALRVAELRLPEGGFAAFPHVRPAPSDVRRHPRAARGERRLRRRRGRPYVGRGRERAAVASVRLNRRRSTRRSARKGCAGT